MNNTLRVLVGLSIAVGGLVVDVAPASAHLGAPVQICRYYASGKAQVPLRRGPGKFFEADAWLTPARKAPIFGSCADRGRGNVHNWIRISQGRYKGLWVWRNNVDRY